MTLHATGADYRTWIGVASDAALPANFTPLLRSASGLIDDAIFAAVYDVDTDGNPTDAKVLQALSDATCAQVAAWAQAGIDPLAGGIVTASGGVKASKSLDGASFTYADAGAAVTARANLADSLAPEAVRILARAGLTSSVWSYG